MENRKGLPKLDQINLKVNGFHSEDSDVDEDAIKDKKRSEEILRRQFENFDNSSDEESERSVSSASSRSAEESHPETNQILNHHFTNGMILNRLSDISEHSLNNSHQNVSKDSGTTSPTKSPRLHFSSSANKFRLQNYSPGNDAKGDYRNDKPILETKSNTLTSLTHQNIFSGQDSNNQSIHPVENSDVFKSEVFDGRGDENYKPILNNNSSLEKSENDTPVSSVLNSHHLSQHFEKNNEDSYYCQTVFDGRGDENYQPIFNNNSSLVKSENSTPLSSFNNSNHLPENFEHNSAKAYRQADMNSIQELQVLYEVRLRENKQLCDRLQAEQQDKANMFRKMALLDAEKERAILSRTEADKLLVKNKEEISNLQKEVDSLKQKILTLEEDKAKNEELLLMSKMQCQDLEQRINLMERCDPNKSYVKLTDIKLQEMKNSHKKEMLLMQNEIDQLNKKLSGKDENCLLLEKKLNDLQRTHDALFVDKSETINQLAHRLEESQAQCQKLMAANVSIDNIRLQAQLDEANKEREQLNQTIRDLKVECQMMKSDLAQYESVSRLNLPNSQSSSDETDSIVQLGISSSKRSSHHSNLNSSDINTKLKEELHRALLNQKAKRAEISRLKQIVCDKEEQIKDMTNQERIYLSETEKLSDQLNKITAELTFFQERNKEDSYQNQSHHQVELSDQAKQISDLKSELSRLHQDKKSLEKQKSEIQRKFDSLSKRFEDEKRKDIRNHDKEYLKFHDETVAKLRKDLEEENELKIQEYRVRLDHSLKEVSDLKLMYVSVCEAKEQLSQSLKDVTSKLEKVNKEKEKLEVELKENISIRDQLAKKLNSTHSNAKKDSYLEEKLIEERDKLKIDYDKCVEIKNQLVEMVDAIKLENEELKSKVEKLNQMRNSSPKSLENQLSEECEQLRAELASMSARHTQELSAARAELQNARDRVLQLEKSTRQQFETELKSLRQDRDMLKTKCDEKEVQIKKLIESRKRPPPVVHSCTQTDVQDVTEAGSDLQRLEERHRLELARCTEEYDGMLAVVEGTHQQALEQLKSSHQLILEDIMHKVEQREAEMLAAHKQELHLIEERTKQITVKYFAEEVKKLEAKYKDESNHKVDSSVINTLHQSLIEKSKEVESLKHQLAALNEEWKQQLTSLRNQAESEKENTAQMMVQWAKEVKNMEGELKLKEALIDEQREKLEKAILLAKKYRDKLVKTNQQVTAQYMGKCAEYKSEMMNMMDEAEKEVREQVKQMQEAYEKREKELKKALATKYGKSQKKEHFNNAKEHLLKLS